MEKLNSYFGMGINDYMYAKAGVSVGDELGNYNGVASMASQSAEKLLKAVIEQCFDDDESIAILHSHNLRALLNRIKEKYPNIELDTKECKWLGDFYFDARYPGDNFVTVNKEDAVECIKINEQIIKVVKEILENEKKSRKENLEHLKKYKLDL